MITRVIAYNIYAPVRLAADPWNDLDSVYLGAWCGNQSGHWAAL